MNQFHIVKVLYRTGWNWRTINKQKSSSYKVSTLLLKLDYNTLRLKLITKRTAETTKKTINQFISEMEFLKLQIYQRKIENIFGIHINYEDPYNLWWSQNVKIVIYNPPKIVFLPNHWIVRIIVLLVGFDSGVFLIMDFPRILLLF